MGGRQRRWPHSSTCRRQGSKRSPNRDWRRGNENYYIGLIFALPDLTNKLTREHSIGLKFRKYALFNRMLSFSWNLSIIFSKLLPESRRICLFALPARAKPEDRVTLFSPYNAKFCYIIYDDNTQNIFIIIHCISILHYGAKIEMLLCCSGFCQQHYYHQTLIPRCSRARRAANKRIIARRKQLKWMYFLFLHSSAISESRRNHDSNLSEFPGAGRRSRTIYCIFSNPSDGGKLSFLLSEYTINNFSHNIYAYL